MQRILTSFFLFISFFSFAQKDTLSIIKHTSEWIVNQNSRVVYRGIPNKFSIEVPNSLSFSVSGFSGTEKDVEDTFLKGMPLFMLMVNSIVFPHKYK